MNPVWKKTIICAAIGLVLGLLALIVGQIGDLSWPVRILVTVLILPLAVNLEYWGWVTLKDALSRSSMFLVMTPAKWLILILILIFISYIVGLVAFPRAIVTGVKNNEQ